MNAAVFNKGDLKQMEERGISPDKVYKQTFFCIRLQKLGGYELSMLGDIFAILIS